MPTINLREHYPDAHPEDFFVEVSEEVHQALAELKRKEDALIRQIYRYHAYHSLDDPHLTLEQSILCPPQNPLDAVEQRHHLRHINDAILSLPQKQAQRCYDYYYLGMPNAASLI